MLESEADWEKNRPGQMWVKPAHTYDNPAQQPLHPWPTKKYGRLHCIFALKIVVQLKYRLSDTITLTLFIFLCFVIRFIQILKFAIWIQSLVSSVPVIRLLINYINYIN